MRPVYQEHAEGFEPLGNNSIVLEMLNVMKQGMEERDNQLKLQLQLRDEYIEVEYRRRDQNIEEALKQRDEEWKSRWEQREQELNAELKAREDAFIFEKLRRESELFKIMKEICYGEEHLIEGRCLWVSIQGKQEGDQSIDRKRGQGIGGHLELQGEVLDIKLRYDQQKPH